MKEDMGKKLLALGIVLLIVSALAATDKKNELAFMEGIIIIAIFLIGWSCALSGGLSCLAYLEQKNIDNDEKENIPS